MDQSKSDETTVPVTVPVPIFTQYQEELEKRIREQIEFREFKKNIKKYIVTSVFTEPTFQTNRQFIEKIKTSPNPQMQSIECIYCSSVKMSVKIPLDSVVYVLEMNNTQNKIEGIGLVRNHPHINRFRIYENMNYNRFNFVGKNRIDRKEMTVEEEEIMAKLDVMCFRGKNHLKRQKGLYLFPPYKLFEYRKEIDFIQCVVNMFKNRMCKPVIPLPLHLPCQLQIETQGTQKQQPQPEPQPEP